jgi:hypothetical protein
MSLNVQILAQTTPNNWSNIGKVSVSPGKIQTITHNYIRSSPPLSGGCSNPNISQQFTIIGVSEGANVQSGVLLNVILKLNGVSQLQFPLGSMQYMVILHK